MMRISIIVAVDANHGIGFEGRIPWHLGADLRFFKRTTMGHHLIMGRKTFESIGKPLPGRTTILLTRDRNSAPPQDCWVVHSLQAALDLAEEHGEDEVFVVGGGEIYRQTLPLAHRLYLTQVHASLPADVYFPELNLDEWVLTNQVEQSQDNKNQYAFTMKILDRKGGVA